MNHELSQCSISILAQIIELNPSKWQKLHTMKLKTVSSESLKIVHLYAKFSYIYFLGSSISTLSITCFSLLIVRHTPGTCRIVQQQ